jgi:large subunit ribosomal protein L6
MKKEMNYSADIPEGVEINLEGKTLIVNGTRGENRRLFHYPGVSLIKEDKKVSLNCKVATKKEKSMMGVFLAHVKNMIEGVREGFVYKLKICSGHFPMNVEIKDQEVVVNNFLGEKKPRVAKILDGVKVNLDGETITVESHNKESAGQCAANLENMTRIRGRDRRIFQDGIFITEKNGKQV